MSPTTPSTPETAGAEQAADRPVAEDAIDRSSTVGQPLLQRIVVSPQFLVLVVIALFVAYGATRSPQFLDASTWINISRNAVFILIVGSFTTFVFVSGGLDLSVGSVFAVGAMTSAWLAFGGHSTVVAAIGGCLAGGVCGLVNGVLVNYASIPAFITTLGMLYAARSVVTFSTGGNPIGPLPDSFGVIGQTELGSFPLLVVYAGVVAVLAYVLLEKTTFGWSVRAVGGNREAANNAGINVRRVSTTVYALSGLSAGLAGMLIASRLGSGQPSLGTGFELQIISAVIIGGTSLFGGIGSIPGTVLGSLVLSILTTGLILLRIDPVLQDFVVGVIIVVAVGLDQLRRKRMFRAVRR